MGKERIWHDYVAQFAYVRYKLFRQQYCMQNSLFLTKSGLSDNAQFIICAKAQCGIFVTTIHEPQGEYKCHFVNQQEACRKGCWEFFWGCCNYVGQQFKILKDFGIDRLWATSCCICDFTQHDYQRWIWFGLWILFWSTWSFTWNMG